MIALAAGLLAGFALSTLAYRYHYLRVPGGYPFERMTRELNLTPAQQDQMRAIMHQAHIKMMQQRQQLDELRHQDFRDAFTQMRAILTPEQQKKFDEEFAPPPNAGPPPDHGDLPPPPG